MERKEVKSFLWKQLKKLPSKLQNNETDLQKIKERIDIAPIEAFLQDNLLNIKAEEVPNKEVLLKIILFFILNNEREEGVSIYYLESSIFDLDDHDTVDMIEKLKLAIDSKEQEAQLDVTATKIEEFLVVYNQNK